MHDYNVLMRLMREVRCFPAGNDDGESVLNSWASTPGRGGFEMFWTLRAVVEGPADERTGYVCDIKRIDAVLRGTVVPGLREKATGDADVAAALRVVFPLAAKACPPEVTLQSLELAVSPFLRFTADRGDREMIQVTQSFEFSAAHRLHCEGLSAQENLRLFGKCSNPGGHGHNYVLEVTVVGEPDADTGRVVSLPRLQRTVEACVIHPFDHKNLNEEVADFRALNPSVENIARVIWKRLHAELSPAVLSCVRVWETPKTYAEFRGEG